VCASHCAQLLHTILHRTDMIVFPLTLQTITTAPMMSIWGKGGGQIQDEKIAKKSPSGHHPSTLSGYIFAIKACIDNRKRNLISSHISSTCPHHMVNFGPTAADIVSLVWGTPANFNGFHVLTALLHGTLVMGVSQTLRRWTDGAT